MSMRGTIFNHLFVRMAVILFGVSMAFSLMLTPIYHFKLMRMLTAQGNTFANTAVAASGEALYTKDYSFVINYINNVLKKTPEITFVNFISNEGLRLNLSARGWRAEHGVPISDDMFTADQDAYSIKRLENTDTNGIQGDFVFLKPVNIGGLDWGFIEVGISDSEYNSLMLSYLGNVFLFAFILILIALLILHGSLTALSGQLARLRETALKLSEGNLSARAPTEGAGEIGLLAAALNSMADSLKEEVSSAQKLVRLVEDTNDAIAIFDPDGEITFVNPSLISMVGGSFEQYRGMLLHELLDHLGLGKESQREVLVGMSSIDNSVGSVCVDITPASKETLYMSLRVEAFYPGGGEKSGFFVVLSDITHRKQQEHDLEKLSSIDSLTRLPNRRYFLDRMAESIKEASRYNKDLAVSLLELQAVEGISDTLGHEAGYFVLAEVGRRIQAALRTDDIVCRLGGNEFAVIIKGVENKEQLEGVVEIISGAFEKPIRYMDRELPVEPSIGIACYPQDGRNVKDLLKKADAAMYVAKHAGENAFSFCAQGSHRNLRSNKKLEWALCEAVGNSDFQLVYHPFFDMETQAVSSCEALVRWKHPELGFVSPDRFIPVAEQSGLVGDIGNWVFTEVCKQMSSWDFEMNVSVNVTGGELVDKDFIRGLEDTLAEYEIEPDRIQLEFTEQAVVSRDIDSLSILNVLKGKRFNIAVDDFGTGFSSLSYITELPVDVIKVDKFFISKLPKDRRAEAIVKSIILLADSLGIETVGEGAETKEQVDWLCAHGCKKIQGDYFYQAMTAQELKELVNGLKTSAGAINT